MRGDPGVRDADPHPPPPRTQEFGGTQASEGPRRGFGTPGRLGPSRTPGFPRGFGTPGRLGPSRTPGSSPERLSARDGVGVGVGGTQAFGRGPRRSGEDPGVRAMGRSPWVWGRRRAPRAPPPPAPPAAPALPPLAVTLRRLLGALEPLVSRADRGRARRLVREFGAPGGEGPRLHERLRRLSPAPPRLPEWPWVSSERLPLPVHTSAGLMLPRQDWEDWRGQLGFAARLIAGVIDYRLQLQRCRPPELWLQAAFGGCRVPGPRRDEVLRVPPGAQPPPCVTVSRNGQFFEVPLGGEGPPPAAALLPALDWLRGRAGRGGAPPVGLLTGQHRKAWARAHAVMMRDRLNRDSIGRIRRSLFALSLDAPVLAAAAGRGPEGGAKQVLHGGGAGANSANRWFDKTLQFIVGEDGTCGVVYDPAVIDGAVVAEMVDHALEFCRRPEPGPAPAGPAHPPPQRLRFSIGPETANELERAKRHLDSLAADVRVHCSAHPGWVAFYRTHGSLCASCEPTSLRHVLPGCSDLLRPPGPPCLALARALGDPHAQPELQGALLREAVEAQTRHAREVLAGAGPERHLQGLRAAAQSGGGPLPRLFLDPAYVTATHFRLCSMQVRSREGCWLLRGPLVPDGYGVGVGHALPPPRPRRPRRPPRRLLVAVAAFACCPHTDPARLGEELGGVLDALRGLLGGH
ncbi:LOW QUALITY PROTEIN: carnitine O-acetyltransferase-like [Caloenas nicobarica]|uniref:LOW QUALITY PROTEIN: carnitine O-acetyltransferase-like n=1 Tax=Caloenas nicobarica TaxID=187106 RepID=UPI0032B7D778